MTPSEIKPGMKFGNWLVIKYDHSNEHRVKYFLCQCQVCGTYRPVRGTSLLDGSSTACSQACRDNLVGQRFGRWTVLKLDSSRPRYYICKCDCGTIKSVFSGSLKNGATKSCGCLKVQKTKEKNEKSATSHIGEKYGLLTVQDCVLKGKDYWYRCKCDCGNEKLVLGKRLFSGVTQSCGCINSWANTEMENILKKYGIRYKREYKLEDCRDKYPLPFDFAIFNKVDELVGLIENQGSQHYSVAGFSSHAYDDLLYIQKHDKIKQRFCEANHIPLLIIPYQFFNELEKFLTTSDFWQIMIRNFNDYEPLNLEDSEEHIQDSSYMMI